MGLEIERKWLVPERPGALDDLPGERIEQGYLAIGEDSEARIRNQGDGFVLTVKSSGGLSRSEIEISLSPEQFHTLWESTAGRRVVKERFNLPGGVDVDVYEPPLAGLIVAEVEFASEQAAAAYATPDWFGVEVTEDRAYKNQQLALKGRPPA